MAFSQISDMLTRAAAKVKDSEYILKLEQYTVHDSYATYELMKSRMMANI